MAWEFPQIDPVAFAVGPFAVRWYALAYLAGILAGWKYVCYLAKLGYKGREDEIPLKQQALDDFLPWAIAGVIFGGRIGYILFYQFGYYIENPTHIFAVWEGGMSFHGGALGVIVAMIVYAMRHKLPLLRLTDLVCCAVPIGLFFGRLANFINGELFGRVTEAPIGMVFPRGGDLPRHPSQLYEAVLEGLVLFLVLLALAHKDKIRNKPGIISGVFLIGYGLSRFTIEFFREPDEQIGYLMTYFTMGQLLCVPMVLGGLTCIFYALRFNKESGDNGLSASTEK